MGSAAVHWVDGRQDATDQRYPLLLFVVTILASAFLIFLVQPMVGKRILPWFGGSPGVWTLCLAFYQVTLFLGYAYAHLLIRFASPAVQLGVHTLMICAALFVLPVLPDISWIPEGVGTPSSDILWMLVSNVALPFLVLASTGPLVQAWFARRYPARSPYPLYAVSNLGSFGALIAYPFLLEPRLSLSLTGAVWSYAFAATTAAVLGCGAVARFATSRVKTAETEHTDAARPRAGGVQTALWFLLPGCAVTLMMGVTNAVCLDIASVPFLWILPLATYLMTFVLTFMSERFYHPIPYAIVTVAASVATLGLPLFEDWGLAPKNSLAHSVFVLIPAYCALVFGGCMIMHGELYRLRPPPRALTAFYLWISAGGAAGGLFVALLAPVLFDGYYEVRVSLGLAAALFLAATAVGTRMSGRGGIERRRWIVATVFGLVLGGFALWPFDKTRHTLLHAERNFFGVLRVLETSGSASRERHLTSGTTLHGIQLMDASLTRVPTSYYGKATGIGILLLQRDRDVPVRVGVMGLGIGTLAAYAGDGDYFRFYEIDPAVVHLARDAGYFSFLSRSRAEIDVVLGDARLAIADEQVRGVPQEYDFLILDAFSSDSVPIHLLTLEAFRVYLDSLGPKGVVAAHVSNRHFDLMPLIARVGVEVGLSSLYVRNTNVPGRSSVASHWVLMSRDPRQLSALANSMNAKIASMRLPPRSVRLQQPVAANLERIPLWSDDYSDLFSALRRK